MLPLILLHGALGAALDLAPLASVLKQDFEIHCLDFPGHGAGLMPDRPFDLRYFSEVVLRYLDQHGKGRAHIFGYSMGGCVGMLAAEASPERIASVVTLGTKYFWDAATSASEVSKLDAEKIEVKVPAYAASLAALHGAAQWKSVVGRTQEMIRNMGTAAPFPSPAENFAAIRQPSLLMVGDRDKMVPRDETARVADLLPDAQLCVLPGTPHPIGQVSVEMLAFHIRTFLSGQ